MTSSLSSIAFRWGLSLLVTTNLLGQVGNCEHFSVNNDSRAIEQLSFFASVEEPCVTFRNLEPGRNYEIWLETEENNEHTLWPVADGLSFTSVRSVFYFRADTREQTIVLRSDCPEEIVGQRILVNFRQRRQGGFGSRFSTMTVNSGVSDQFLIEDVFIGSECFEVFNVTGIGSTEGRGTFAGGAPDLDFDEGMLIASGNISVAIGPNNVENASETLPGNESDPDLAALVTSSVQDASGIEFDFIPTVDEISFDYIFASEEYEEYVCSQFNDVFGFFITGPNPDGGTYNSENIAIIPGTNLAVAINSVNPGVAGNFGTPGNCTSLTNTQYYNSNAGGTTLQFDGYTDVFTATARVVPCETYHIKLVVGDVGDQIFDSGVFFSLNSFQAGGALEAGFVGGIPGGIRAQESCGETPFLLVSRLPGDDASEPLEITFTVSPFSTATLGADYDGISDGANVLVIPAGVFFLEIPINIIPDGIIEGVETIIIDIENSCSCETNTTVLEIVDQLTALLSPINASCGNEDGTVFATILNGIPPYNYTYTSDNGSSGSGSGVAINNLGPGTYDFTYTDAFGCEAMSQVTILSPPGPTISCSSTDETLPSTDDGTFSVHISGGSTPYSVEWDGMISGDSMGLDTGLFVLTNVPPGDYEITVTDAEGCTSNCAFSILEVFCAFNAVPSLTDSVLCAGACTGAVSLEMFEGIPPYTFAWAGPTVIGNEQQPDSLCAGLYSVTVTDSSGCQFDTTILISEPSPLEIVCSATDESIPNANNGSATIDINGATPFYQLSWAGPVSGDTVNLDTGIFTLLDLLPGDYNITVTDANGCQATCGFSIAAMPCMVTLDPVLSSPILCFGDCTAGISLNVSNASAPFDFIWSGPTPIGNEQNPTGLCAGFYAITMTDANGCQFDTSIIVPEPDPLQISCTATDETMLDANDGTATISIVGGTPLYSLSWSGPNSGTASDVTAGNFLIDSLPPGDYTILLTDAVGCTTNCSFTVLPIVCDPVMIATLSSEIACFGECTAAITLEVSNATPPFDFDWSGPTLIGNEQTPSNLCVGDYSVTLTDAVGCTAVASVTITEPSPLLIICSATDESIPNANNGTASIDISGGTPLYELNWTGPVSGDTMDLVPGLFTISDLPPGDYVFTVVDANGCQEQCSFSVAAMPCTATIAPEITNTIGCFGACTGGIGLTVANASPPFDFNWSGPTPIGNEQHPSGLCAGVYAVTLTDGNGCQFDTSITLTEPIELVLNCTATDETFFEANDGTATINIGGETPPYSLSWSGPTSGTASGLTAGDFFIDNLPPGEYSVILTDANGCTTSCNFTVLPIICEPLVLPNISNGIACFGACTATITLDISNASPPYTFVWSGPTPIGDEQNPSNLCPGTYSVSMTDANGCQFDTSITVIEPTPLSINCSATDESVPNANDGQAVISIAGATPLYSISWSGPAPGNATDVPVGDFTITDLIPGDYNVTVTDANGCVQQCAFSIAAVPCAVVVLPQISNTVSCFGACDGAIALGILNAQPPFNFVWAGPTPIGNEQNPTGLCSGTYSVTLTDANNCSFDTSIFVPEPSPLTISCSATDETIPNADNGMASIEVGGATPPYALSWIGPVSGVSTDQSAGPFELTDLPPGSYQIEVTDANGCSAQCSFIIEAMPCTAAVTAEITSVIACSGQCSGAIALTITNAQPPYTFNWAGASDVGNVQNPTELCSGAYAVTVTDANQCVFSTSISIAAGADYPLALINQPDEINCDLTSVVINASSSTSGASIVYQWYDEQNNPIPGATSPFLQANQAGNYTLVVTDTLNGCSGDNVITVNADLEAPVADAGSSQSLNCMSTDLQLDGSSSSSGSNISYNWSTANGNILSGHNTYYPSINAPGTYRLYVTNNDNGCSAEDLVEVEEIILERAALTRSNPSCFGFFDGSIIIDSVIGGTPPFRYSLNGSFFLNASQWSGLQSGSYNITVRDAIGCETDVNVTLTEPNPVEVYAGEDQIIQLGESVRLMAQTNISGNQIESINWQNAASLDCPDCLFPWATPLETTTYEIEISNIDGCVDRDQVTIFVDRNVGVYIPSAFSPNDDGINDVFHIFAREGVERVLEMKIFDRWGEQVFFNTDFAPNDPAQGWDGTHRGEPLNPAVFVYYAEVELLNGDVQSFKGDVTLIR